MARMAYGRNGGPESGYVCVYVCIRRRQVKIKFKKDVRLEISA